MITIDQYSSTGIIQRCTRPVRRCARLGGANSAGCTQDGVQQSSAHRLKDGVTHPNLRLRPHAPNKGRGRLQIQVRRCFVGYRFRTTSQVFDYVLARVRGDAWRQRHRWSVIRVLVEEKSYHSMAVPIVLAITARLS
jgi:hypothetical protein